ncbi:MAG TPA: flavin reductase [Candidatus Thalassarchaeaceae archaeon]|nr:flavin reductase [Candidatus Thalassarchaeaceae archaeon]
MSKDAVCDFLRRCVLYADSSIDRKKGRDEDIAEIERWIAYRDFTAYALSEVERGELNDWFDSDGGVEQKRETLLGQAIGEGIRNESVDALEHPERSEWLSALIAPRPVLLLSTISEQGVANLCPVTSVALLANTPPLIGVSLSQDRSGRPRDTLVNLRSGSKISAMVLPGTWDAALLVNETAVPLPPEKSEWGSLDDAIESPNGFPPYHPLSAAVLECEVAELHPLPDSVATLAILRVQNILRPDIGTNQQMPPDAETWGPLLTQFGMNRLTSGPDGATWSFEVRSHLD